MLHTDDQNNLILRSSRSIKNLEKLHNEDNNADMKLKINKSKMFHKKLISLNSIELKLSRILKGKASNQTMWPLLKYHNLFILNKMGIKTLLIKKRRKVLHKQAIRNYLLFVWRVGE